MKRALLLFLAVLLVSGCRSDYSGSPEFADDHKSPHYVILLHNRERAGENLEMLAADDNLMAKAQKHAEWMATKRSLTHSKLGGTSFSTMGENIAMGYEDEPSVTKGWMDSSGHRRNILNKRFTHAGVGYARLPNGRPYWCVVFGGH